MEADEVNSKSAEIFERVNQLAQATSKSVISRDDNRIHRSLPTVRKKPVARRPVLLCPANSFVYVLGNDFLPPPTAIVAQLFELNLGILAVLCAHPRINCRAVHRLPLFFLFEVRPPNSAHFESSTLECFFAWANPPFCAHIFRCSPCVEHAASKEVICYAFLRLGDS